MPNKIKKAFFPLFKRFIRNGLSQEDWEQLYLLSLHEMNYGTGTELANDGELFVMRYIREKLGASIPVIIFDVGANVGSYTKALADSWGENATIHSFEPSAGSFRHLQTMTAGLKNIIANNFGFSDHEHQADLYSPGENSGLASLYQRKLDHFGIDMNQREEIQLTTIDSYCDRKQIRHIHFLKLDVEGHELSVLQGAGNMIRNDQVDFIQFEFGGCNIDAGIFFQRFWYLLIDQYKIYRVLRNGLHEIPSYKETYEIFITTNYLAVRKGLSEQQ